MQTFLSEGEMPQTRQFLKVGIKIAEKTNNYKVIKGMIDDTVKCPYTFTFTPLKIENRNRAKVQQKKKVLVKLGSSTVKFDYFDTPLKINVEVLYSKIMQKYYSLKGIIKVFDVSEDGSEMISSVGAFQTDELLNEKRTHEIIQKQLGSTLVKMKIQAKPTTDGIVSETQPKLNGSSQISQLKRRKSSKEENNSLIYGLQEIQPEMSKKQSYPSFTKNIKPSSALKFEQYQCNRISFQESQIPHQSSTSNLSMTCPELFEEYQKREMEILGEELIEERRKNRLQEEDIEKLSLKVQALRRKNKQYENHLRNYESANHNFIQSLEQNWKGQYLFELNEKKGTLQIKYKKQLNFSLAFQNFLNLISNRVLSNKKKNLKQQETSENSQVDSLLNKIEEIYSGKSKQQGNNAESFQFKATIDDLNKRINEQEFQIQSKTNELEYSQEKMEELSKRLKSMEDENTFMKEKDQQMQYLLSTKENSIQNLRKMLSNVSSQMDEVEEENLNFKRKIRNFELTIEELREQVSNKEEIIQKYMHKYGNMKKPQTRDIENEINDCLRWINQQNKIVAENSMDETLQSEIFDKGENSLTSILKNTDKIEECEKQELVKFRSRLLNVVKAIEEKVGQSQNVVFVETFSDLKK